MVEPVGRRMQHAALAGLQVDDEQLHRHTRGPALKHAHALGLGEVQRAAVGAHGCVFRLARATVARVGGVGLERRIAIGHGADAQGLVGVDRAEAALLQMGDATALAAVDIDGEQGAAPVGRLALARIRDGIIDGPGLAAGQQQVGIAVGDQHRTAEAVVQLDLDDPLGRREDEDVALGREHAAVEVELVAAFVARQADDAVARLRIDPVGRDRPVPGRPGRRRVADLMDRGGRVRGREDRRAFGRGDRRGLGLDGAGERSDGRGGEQRLEGGAAGGRHDRHGAVLVFLIRARGSGLRPGRSSRPSESPARVRWSRPSPPPSGPRPSAAIRSTGNRSRRRGDSRGRRG